MTENEIYDKFLIFEKQNKFFKYKFNNLQIWDYVRYYYYNTLCSNALNIYSQVLPAINPIEVETNDYIESHDINIEKLKNYDVLLMGNPRRVKQEDNTYFDIYVDCIPEILKNLTCITIEDPFWNQFTHNVQSHLTPAYTKNMVYTDKIIHDFYNTYFLTTKFNDTKQELHEILVKVERCFCKEFGYDFNSSTESAILLLLFIFYSEEIYIKILKKINPKIILFIMHPNPSSMSLLNCAKKLNIPIVDIQHGIIGEFEPIWHKFQKGTGKHFLPDYIFGLSPKLLIEKNMPLTFKNSKIKFVGYPFLEKKIKQYSIFEKDKKDKKYILFVSQTNIGEKLSQFAAELSILFEKYPQYHILYKLHPFELNKKYPCLERENITIISDLNKEFYYYSSIASIQVGVYSTAIYEGIMFNTTTIIVDGIMGSNEAKNILKTIKGVYVTKSPNEAYKLIINNPEKSPTINSLWGNFDAEKYNSYILEIINSNSKKTKL